MRVFSKNNVRLRDFKYFSDVPDNKNENVVDVAANKFRT